MSNEPNVSVTVRDNEPIEKALRRFRRLCDRAGIKRKVREKECYLKPSAQRRKDEMRQVRNRRRAERKAQMRQARKQKKMKQRTTALAKSAAAKVARRDA